MAVTTDKPAPYAPPAAILSLIERHRTRGLPAPVNAEVLARAGVAESLIPRTLQALITLDLIDESGQPTNTFEGIRLAPEVEYQQRLQDWLKAAYADVFSFVDPVTDDETAVRDAFRSYQPVGQQSRMVTLFMTLCGAAGLAPERSTQTRPQARTRTTTAQPARRATPTKQTKGAKTAQLGIPPALAGLLDSLPPEGGGWSQDRRDKFVKTFGTVLDFCFPIVKPAPEANNDSEEVELE